MERENRNPIGEGLGLLKEMTKHICRSLPTEEGHKIFKSVILKYTQISPSSLSVNSQFEDKLCQRIEKHLILLNKGNKEIILFRQLLRTLKQNENTADLKYRCYLLVFFLTLSELNYHNSKDKQLTPNEVFKMPLTKTIPSAICKFQNGNKFDRGVTKSPSADFVLTDKNTFVRPTSLHKIGCRKDQFSNVMPKYIERSPTAPLPLSALNRDSKHTTSLSLMSAAPNKMLKKSHKLRIPECNVVKDLLACFQGIQSTTFKLDHQQGFKIDSHFCVPQKGLVLKLIELGYLHNKICSQNKLLEKKGTVSMSILAAVKNMLSDYYRVIGNIHFEHVNSSRRIDDTPMSDNEDCDAITIARLLYLMREYFLKLKVLADVTRIASSGRGGAIISSLDLLRRHGNPFIRAPINIITTQAGQPIVNMIITWMVDGELFDPYDEFFISVNTSCHDRDIWRDKFILRNALIPSLIKQYQAQNILKSGKAIHFLNVICEKKIPIEGSRAKLNSMRDCNISEFANPRSEIYNLIALVAEENSKQVLDTVVNKFKLFLHFQGLRRYILLGQGDFASYFMELVEPEMKKQAAAVQYHELSSSLQTAIKASTAAHEDPDVIKKVSVKLMEAAGGDWGSDVFGLHYLMNEPLSAAFRLREGAYSHLFNFLWRTKRMEHKLLMLRKERWATKNTFYWLGERMKDVNGVLMLADRLVQEFLHFARQFHYYILFEVVECLWQKFCTNFKKAKSFDDVIKAHDNFIEEMQQKTFQTKSRTITNELRLIWDLVLELEVLEDRFFKRTNTEYEVWKAREAAVEEFGSSYAEKNAFNGKQKEYKSFLSSIRAQYSIINRNYQEVLKKFLLELSSQKDHELRLLSDRIDYNEYYKKSDSRISDSMKFSRCSDLFG